MKIGKFIVLPFILSSYCCFTVNGGGKILIIQPMLNFAFFCIASTITSSQDKWNVIVFEGIKGEVEEKVV